MEAGHEEVLGRTKGPWIEIAAFHSWLTSLQRHEGLSGWRRAFSEGAESLAIRLDLRGHGVED
jgi:hypothetical protein